MPIASAIGHLRRRLRGHFRAHVVVPALRLLYRPARSLPIDVLFPWCIPPGELGEKPVCYCAGVGENIDLELALIERYDARVFAFDPTPRAIRFVEQAGIDPERFTFVPVGLWSSDTVLKFFGPADPAHVSHSIVEIESERDFFEAECRKVSTLMGQLGHDRIDLLKMNIEGAEYEVLAAMMADGVKPKVIAVAFEGPGYFRQCFRWRKKLDAYGYDLVGIRYWMATFVRRGA